MQQEAYLQILQREFDKKKEKNPRYSLRVFARHLDIDHSTLSQIFSKKRGISENLAKKMVGNMTLTHHEKQKFLTSVETCFARAKKKKAAAAEKMTKISRYADAVVLHHDPANSITHWTHVVVYELVANQRINSAALLAQKLNLPIEQINGIIRQLCDLKIFTLSSDGVISTTASAIHTLNDIPAEAIVKYHASVAEKAAQAVKSQPILEREFQNLVISFSKDQMPGAKQMIRDFISEFSAKYYTEQKDTEVFSLAINFFSLERP